MHLNFLSTPRCIAQRIAMGAILLSAFILGGCTHTIYVPTDFPSPLIEKLPHTVGVYYAPEFSAYQYTEESKDRTKWVIDSGPAQQAMFKTMMKGMFQNVVEINSMPPWPAQPQADIILAPSVEDLQYTEPRETKINVYEIWIKYNVQVFTPDGSLLADWILTSYGKTPKAFIQSPEGALIQAFVVSMRDAGANLALNFAKVPEIRAWLAQNSVQYSSLPEGTNP